MDVLWGLFGLVLLVAFATLYWLVIRLFWRGWRRTDRRDQGKDQRRSEDK